MIGDTSIFEYYMVKFVTFILTILYNPIYIRIYIKVSNVGYQIISYATTAMTLVPHYCFFESNVHIIAKLQKTVFFFQPTEVAKLNATEWYFFSFRDRKYATGFRTNRATTSGYWKATGKDRTVLDPMSREIVGMRKTLVFYRNRAPNGIKTGWIMHEFRLETPHMPPKV